MKDKQLLAINVNTIITGLVAALLGLLCWFGRDAIAELRATSAQVIQLRTEVIGLKTELQDTVRRPEFEATVSGIKDRLNRATYVQRQPEQK